jgi:hypothetical protein
MAESGGAAVQKKTAAAKPVYKAEIKVMQGKLALQSFRLAGAGEARFPKAKLFSAGEVFSVVVI